MEIVVQLRSELAQLINRRQTSLRAAAAGNADLESLAATLARFKADLIPQHPGADEPQLQTWFVVSCDARDESACASLVGTLQQDAAVRSAYLKPDAEPAPPM